MKLLIKYALLLVCVAAKAQQPFMDVRRHLSAHNYARVEKILDSCAAQKFHSDSVLYYRGLAALKRGERKPAKKMIRKLSDEYPSFAETEYLKGLLSFAETNYGKSIDHFSRVIRERPAHQKALYNRAIAFGMIDEYLAAIEDLTALIAADPNHAQAYYARAYWYEFTGNYIEAARDYEKTIALDPRNYDAYLGLAFIQHAQKDTAAACATISRAIDAGSQVAGELKENYCK